MRKLLYLFAVIPFFFFSHTLFGQVDSIDSISYDSIPQQGIFDLLTHNQITDITITTAFKTFLENKRNRDYLEGKFFFKPTEDTKMTLPVRLRLRGRYRRMKCQFPPLKLKFRKKELAVFKLNEFNELKLVTHCLDDESTSRGLVAREYLTYRLFNIISEHSFRAQLVNVTYKNTKGKPKKIQGYGILIEDADEVAYRLGGEPFDKVGIPDSCINRSQEAIVSLFQYMIGNTDWSCQLNRNVELIQLSENNIFPIPYDFDFCGLVSAPYAVPKASIGQTTVRHRIWQGQARDVHDLHDAVHVFLDKKEELFNEVAEFTLLDEAAREDMKEYLEEFYEDIETDHAVMENLFPVTDK